MERPTMPSGRKEEKLDNDAESRMEGEGGPSRPSSTSRLKAYVDSQMHGHPSRTGVEKVAEGEAPVPAGSEEAVTYVGEIMTKGVYTCRRDSSITAIAALMKEHEVGIVPVVGEDNTLEGVLTDRDIVVRGLTAGVECGRLTAGDVMTSDVLALFAHETLRGALDLMGQRQIRRVPVIDGQRHVLGVLSLGDVIHHAGVDPDLHQALERISERRSFWNRLWT